MIKALHLKRVNLAYIKKQDHHGICEITEGRFV